MSNTQTIIVYSNPLQQAFWESGVIFPALAGVITFFIVYGSITWVTNKLFPGMSRKRLGYVSNTTLLIAINAALVVILKTFKMFNGA